MTKAYYLKHKARRANYGSRRFNRSILILTLVAGSFPNCADANQSGPQLWATVSASDSKFQEGEIKQLMINFTVTNDGKITVDPKIKSSKIVINGKELDDSALIFGNGPRGANWNALAPGGTLRFSYDLAKYFQASGVYRISWKGQGFEAPTIEFKVVSSSPATFASFKRDMMPKVLTEISVEGILARGKLSWLVTYNDWPIYIYETRQSDFAKMSDLNRFEGHTVRVTGTLRYFPEQPPVHKDKPEAVPPEHFYFDVAEVKVVSLSPPNSKPSK
jgi:hypothetical protein